MNNSPDTTHCNVSLCEISRPSNKQFPFSNEELIEALREQYPYANISNKATRKRICSMVDKHTLKIASRKTNKRCIPKHKKNSLSNIYSNTNEVESNQALPIVETESSCSKLFDPCTKEPIENMQALEKRIREIKKQSYTIPVGLYDLSNNTSNYDFLTKVFVNPDISLDDMVSFRLETNSQVGSDIYEVLSRLFVFFGGIENVNPAPGGNYKFMKRFEDRAPEVYEDTIEALKYMKCKATRAMGISDITLINVRDSSYILKAYDPYCEVHCDTQQTTTVKTYLISVKWYAKEKNAEHYDLEKLYTAAQKITSAEQKPLDIIVFLKSKKDFEIAHSRAYRRYTRDLAKTFFGWNEDVKPFLEEKRRLLFESAREMGITPLQALEHQYFRPSAKPILSLQLHQDIIVKGICDRIEIADDDNLYLVGVLPRGGKTYIAGGIMREFLHRTKIPNLNIFWLTAAPNETMSQVSDDLLKRFQDFEDFEFVWVKNTREIRKRKPHSVFFCSTQLLLSAKKPDARERTFLFDLLSGKDKLGLVFFDEAHKTGTGVKTKSEIHTILETYKSIRPPFIFLTATYYNILFNYQIQKDNMFVWDYTDVLMTRALATESEQSYAIHNIQNRFGKELVNAVLQKRKANNETLQTMAKPYLGFPDLYFVSADFQEETKKRFSEQNTYRPDAGFSLSSIFALKHGTTIKDIKTADNRIRKDAYKIFDNLVNPKNIISLITPYEMFDDVEIIGTEGGQPLLKEEGSVLEPSILGRINKMSSDAKSRFRLDERPTMLMFMPTGGTGTNIFYLLCAWASLLMTHKWWRENYEIACVVEEKKVGDVDIRDLLVSGAEHSEFIHIINEQPKKELLTLERRLHCEKSKGLLILAGEKLSMGISLPCTDLVFLLNEKKSPDDIIQKMYRALTPSPGKNAAFVVDLNPIRTLSAVYGYTRAAHITANTSSEILDIIYDNYTWDADVFEYNLKKGAEAKPILFNDKLRQMFEIAEKDTSNEYRINEDIGAFEKKLATNVRRGMNSDFIHKLTGEMGTRKLEAILERIGLREGSKFQFKEGRLVISTSALASKPNEEIEADPGQDQADIIEIQIENFIDTLADFVKYLAITSSAATLKGALEEYETATINVSGSSLQQNVVRMIRGRTDLKEGADKTLLSKLLVAAVKDFAFSSSEVIFRQMKGKIDERQTRKNAVLKIIHKHLTPRKKQKEEKGEVFTPIEFIEDMLSHLPSSVWQNPNLKWLDPANGIGNFPIVAFHKLDEGLKAWEAKDDKRRKHIVENMLYMMEIQSNNSRIARNLFEKLCEGCKPNILTTNSLEMNSDKLKAKGFPEKYDIIIGNPPFNAGGTLKGGGTLWPRFVRLAMNLVAPNGYITFVHPPGWRKFYDPEDRESQGKLLYDIKQKGWHIDYINVSTNAPKHFPVVDYYVIHAKASDEPTQYDSFFNGIRDHGELHMNFPFIPNMISKDTFSILRKLFSAEGTQLNIIRNFGFMATAKDEGKSGIPHYHFTDRQGNKKYYNKEYTTIPEYINKPKVIMTFKAGYEKGKLFAFYSDEQIGTTLNSMYMIVDSEREGKIIQNFLNSPIVTFLMKITQYSAPPNHINEFKILNLLKVPDSMDVYALTPEEQQLINKVVGIKEEVPIVETTQGGARKRRTIKKRRTFKKRKI